MNFNNYNDYELIYLYKEGNSKALELLINKYIILTNKLLITYDVDFKEDIRQDCVMVIYDCIKGYNMNSEASFYTYTKISIQRKIFSYKSKLELDRETIRQYNRNNKGIKGNVSKDLSFIHDRIKIILNNDELLLEIYKNCIIGNVSLKDMSLVLNKNYNYIYYKYKYIISKLKNLLTKI